MIRIEQLEEGLPDDLVQKLGPRAMNEWRTANWLGPKLVAHSETVLALYDEVGEPLLATGVLCGSLCGRPPLAWALVCNAFLCRPSQWRRLKRVWPMLTGKYPVLQIEFDQYDCIGRRFAEFLGFEILRNKGNNVLYEARA